MEFTFNTHPSKPDISSFDKSVDPDQLASQKPADYGHTVFNFSCTYMLITGLLQVNWAWVKAQNFQNPEL